MASLERVFLETIMQSLENYYELQLGYTWDGKIVFEIEQVHDDSFVCKVWNITNKEHDSFEITICAK